MGSPLKEGIALRTANTLWSFGRPECNRAEMGSPLTELIASKRSKFFPLRIYPY